MIIMDMTTKVFNDDVVQPLIKKYFTDESFTVSDKSREGFLSVMVTSDEYRLNIYQVTSDEFHKMSISKDGVVSTEYKILSRLGDFTVFSDIIDAPIKLSKDYPYTKIPIIDGGSVDDLKRGVDKIFEDFYLMG
jgi:hypothetical protein